MGAVLDLLRHAATTLGVEANGVSDNPLILADTDESLSGGNFHAQPVAFTADTIASAVCEIGSLDEQRVAMLVDPSLSGLPAFLTPRPGLDSGLMIPQVTAAAQACDVHAPLEAVRALLRWRVPTLVEDRHLHPDLAEAIGLVASGEIVDAVAPVGLPALG